MEANVKKILTFKINRKKKDSQLPPEEDEDPMKNIKEE